MTNYFAIMGELFWLHGLRSLLVGELVSWAESNHKKAYEHLGKNTKDKTTVCKTLAAIHRQQMKTEAGGRLGTLMQEAAEEWATIAAEAKCT